MWDLCWAKCHGSPVAYCVTKCMCLQEPVDRVLCQRPQSRPHKTGLLAKSCSVTHIINCRGLSSRQIEVFGEPVSTFRWQRTDLVPGISDIKKSNIKCFELCDVNPRSLNVTWLFSDIVFGNVRM
jgi:hypothetical protein